MRRTGVRRVSFFDNPFFDHVAYGRLWKKLSGGDQGLSYREMPRSLHGHVETLQPRTEEVVRWYPYKNEITVSGALKPTFTDVLHTYYWPKTKTDEERLEYAALKSGRTVEEVTAEFYKMRRLKLSMAQSIRMKLRARILRQPTPPNGIIWRGKERAYMLASISAAQTLALSYYFNPSFDPFIVYSPNFQFGLTIDLVINKPNRNALQYCLIDVCVHRTIPRARLPGVIENPKYPLEEVEPCEYEEMKLRLSVAALLLRREGYVVDNNIDGGHKYIGCIMHFFDCGDPDGAINWNIEGMDLDLDLAEKWLLHYKETVLAAAN